MKQLLTFILITILVNGLCLSCTEPVDFDQINDVEITPVVASSLIFFDEAAPVFFDGVNQVITIKDQLQIDFFNDAFIVDNLVKSEFVFEISNTINRGFNMRIDFLDEANNLQHITTISVPASLNNQNVKTNYTEVFQGTTLTALKNTSILVFTLNMLPGTPINQNTLGRISVKSKAVFYLKIENSI